jgi:hypothetical protein
MSEVSGTLTGEVVTGPALNFLREHCLAPAPLVVNGSPYVGCALEKGHDGPHKVEITWAAR